METDCDRLCKGEYYSTGQLVHLLFLIILLLLLTGQSKVTTLVLWRPGKDGD